MLKMGDRNVGLAIGPLPPPPARGFAGFPNPFLPPVHKVKFAKRLELTLALCVDSV